ncbi:hypothetical protein GIB67_028213, partial [Kingdonia uniflora]
RERERKREKQSHLYVIASTRLQKKSVKKWISDHFIFREVSILCFSLFTIQREQGRRRRFLIHISLDLIPLFLSRGNGAMRFEPTIEGETLLGRRIIIRTS